ncbi:unnamed protein product [Chrysoparadoxa australica]
MTSALAALAATLVRAGLTSGVTLAAFRAGESCTGELYSVKVWEKLSPPARGALVVAVPLWVTATGFTSIIGIILLTGLSFVLGQYQESSQRKYRKSAKRRLAASLEPAASEAVIKSVTNSSKSEPPLSCGKQKLSQGQAHNQQPARERPTAPETAEVAPPHQDLPEPERAPSLAAAVSSSFQSIVQAGSKYVGGGRVQTSAVPSDTASGTTSASGAGAAAGKGNGSSQASTAPTAGAKKGDKRRLDDVDGSDDEGSGEGMQRDGDSKRKTLRLNESQDGAFLPFKPSSTQKRQRSFDDHAMGTSARKPSKKAKPTVARAALMASSSRKRPAAICEEVLSDSEDEGGESNATAKQKQLKKSRGASLTMSGDTSLPAQVMMPTTRRRGSLLTVPIPSLAKGMSEDVSMQEVEAPPSSSSKDKGKGKAGSAEKEKGKGKMPGRAPIMTRRTSLATATLNAGETRGAGKPSDVGKKQAKAQKQAEQRVWHILSAASQAPDGRYSSYKDRATSYKSRAAAKQAAAGQANGPAISGAMSTSFEAPKGGITPSTALPAASTNAAAAPAGSGSAGLTLGAASTDTAATGNAPGAYSTADTTGAAAAGAGSTALSATSGFSFGASSAAPAPAPAPAPDAAAAPATEGFSFGASSTASAPAPAPAAAAPASAGFSFGASAQAPAPAAAAPASAGFSFGASSAAPAQHQLLQLLPVQALVLVHHLLHLHQHQQELLHQLLPAQALVLVHHLLHQHQQLWLLPTQALALVHHLWHLHQHQQELLHQLLPAQALDLVHHLRHLHQHQLLQLLPVQASALVHHRWHLHQHQHQQELLHQLLPAQALVLVHHLRHQHQHQQLRLLPAQALALVHHLQHQLLQLLPAQALALVHQALAHLQLQLLEGAALLVLEQEHPVGLGQRPPVGLEQEHLVLEHHPPAGVGQEHPMVLEQHPPVGLGQEYPPVGLEQEHPPAGLEQEHPPMDLGQEHPQVGLEVQPQALELPTQAERALAHLQPQHQPLHLGLGPELEQLERLELGSHSARQLLLPQHLVGVEALVELGEVLPPTNMPNPVPFSREAHASMAISASLHMSRSTLKSNLATSFSKATAALGINA